MDIRPGYCVTVNVLYQPEKHVMRLIDLESLIVFEDDFKTLLQDNRLISYKNRDQGRQISSALEYVLLQAVFVASVWSRRINEVKTEPIIKDFWEENNRDETLKKLEAEDGACSYILSEFDRIVSAFLKDEAQLQSAELFA